MDAKVSAQTVPENEVPDRNHYLLSALKGYFSDPAQFTPRVKRNKRALLTPSTVGRGSRTLYTEMFVWSC
jgi:hypothetical protein